MVFFSFLFFSCMIHAFFNSNSLESKCAVTVLKFLSMCRLYIHVARRSTDICCFHPSTCIYPIMVLIRDSVIVILTHCPWCSLAHSYLFCSSELGRLPENVVIATGKSIRFTLRWHNKGLWVLEHMVIRLWHGSWPWFLPKRIYVVHQDCEFYVGVLLAQLFLEILVIALGQSTLFLQIFKIVPGLKVFSEDGILGLCLRMALAWR